MKSLYRLDPRKVGPTMLLSVVCQRGDIEAKSSEKVLPIIIEYKEDGAYRLITAREIRESVKMHPYKAKTKDFNEERLADLEVASIYKQLENFPTMSSTLQDGQNIPHPVAEEIYKSLIYLKPVLELEKKLNKLNFVQQGKLIGKVLNKVSENLKTHNIHIDLFSIPKTDIGKYCYLADKDGYGRVAKLFSFGLHKGIPADRIVRELSSLKDCERFLTPQEVKFDLPESIKPYVTSLRVAIVGTEFPMLEAADIFPSGIPKLACNLQRERVVKDVTKIRKDERNLSYKPFRSGIDIVHKVLEGVDERKTKPGAIRLIFPGGVKVCGQLQEFQATDSQGKEIDVLMDFETFEKKGAVATLAMLNPDTLGKDLEECKKIFLNLQKEKVYVNGVEYIGFVGELPVMRPGQRYTELSKPTNHITSDLVTKSILKKRFKVNDGLETEYQNLVKFRKVLTKQLEKAIR